MYIHTGCSINHFLIASAFVLAIESIKFTAIKYFSYQIYFLNLHIMVYIKCKKGT